MSCVFQHKSEGSSSKEPRLPPIAEDRTVIPTWNLMQKYSETNTEEPQIQQNQLHPLQLVVNDKGNYLSQVMYLLLWSLTNHLI